MFNLIDPREGTKVDFWLLTDDPFDRERFRRRRVERLLDMDIYLSTPEDTILAKLRWGKLSGGSEKHSTDALRVYELQYPTLDSDYLERWVEALDVRDEWQRLLEAARPVAE